MDLREAECVEICSNTPRTGIEIRARRKADSDPSLRDDGGGARIVAAAVGIAAAAAAAAAGVLAPARPPACCPLARSRSRSLSVSARLVDRAAACCQQYRRRDAPARPPPDSRPASALPVPAVWNVRRRRCWTPPRTGCCGDRATRRRPASSPSCRHPPT